MTDIFFSYSSVDRERVRPIRDALVPQGFDVFWDQQVPAGVDWDTWIRQHLAKSKCAMAFWSASSVASRNVRHEATIADQQGKLIPVLLEPLTAQQFPMGLYAQQAANLAGWSGDLNHHEWDKLRREYEAKLMPQWVRHQIDQLEAELVAQRARCEKIERRDRVLQAQIVKEAEAHQELKLEREKALDEATGLKATIKNLREKALDEATALKTTIKNLMQARLDAEAQEAKALDEAAALKATIKNARLNGEALEAELKLERDRALDEVTTLKTALKEAFDSVTRARLEGEAQVSDLSKRLAEANAQLSALTKSTTHQIGLAKGAMRAALVAKSSAMQIISIAAAVATVGFWTYQLIWSASQTKEAERELAAIKEEVQRQAKAATEADSKRKTAEAEQQRLKDEVQRQTKAAADADARRKAAEERTQAAVQQATPSNTSSRTNFERRTKMVAKGVPFENASGSSAEECEAKCSLIEQCSAVSYSSAYRFCGLYSSSDLTPSLNWDTSIRK